MHEHLRLRQRRTDQHMEHAVQPLAQFASDYLFPVAKQVPLWKQLQLSLQQRFVILR